MLWWWLKKVKSEDEDTRIKAIQKLGTSGSPKAVEPLLEALEAPEYEIVEAAAEGLKGLKRKEAIPGLIGLLERAFWWDITDILDTIDPEWPGSDRAQEAVPELLRSWAEFDQDIRNRVTRALERIRPDWPASKEGRELIASIAGRINGSDVAKAMKAIELLNKIGGPDALEGLKKKIDVKSDAVRKKVATVLQSLGWMPERLEDRIRFRLRTDLWRETEKEGANAVPALLKLMRDKDRVLRKRAAGVLPRVGGKDLIPDLLQLLLDGRHEAEEALDRLDGAWGKTDAGQEVVGVLAKRLNQKKPSSRLEAIRLLGKIGGDAALKLLEEFVSKSNDRLEWEIAMKSLAQLDPSFTLPPEEESPFAPVKCTACREWVDPTRFTGGSNVKVLLTRPGMKALLRCPDCGFQICSGCAATEREPVEGGEVSMINLSCPNCPGRLEMVSGAPSGAVSEEDSYDIFAQAEVLAERGDLKEAAEILHKALKIKPDLYEAYYLRAKLRQSWRNKAGASDDFWCALVYSPADWDRRDELIRQLGANPKKIQMMENFFMEERWEKYLESASIEIQRKVIEYLKRTKNIKAVVALKKFCTSAYGLVRREAETALQELEKGSGPD